MPSNPKARQRAGDLASAREAKKEAQRRFYRALEKYMRSQGRRATGADVLAAAERVWHAGELVRQLEPLRPERKKPEWRDDPVPRVPPKRITQVVNGGSPGLSKRR